MGVSLAEQIERSIFRLLVVVLETRILESTFKTNGTQLYVYRVFYLLL